MAWGLTNGLLENNSLNNIFFDANNWLYFFLIFPIFSVLLSRDRLEIIKKIFLAAIGWLGFKTLILAYIFSHNFNFFISDLYLWVRRSGSGEITQIAPGFSRIFMQSHIFVLIGLIILLFYLLKSMNDKKKLFISYFLLLILCLSTIIISFSRSFWLGLAAGGLFVWLAVVFKLKTNLKKFIAFNLTVLAVVVLGLALALLVVKFPYPKPAADLNAANVLSERTSQITNEAGASSRWRLLPVLWQKIKTAPILGQGFGATVTYKSSDPRILAANLKGEYTTYAFEWGWLDVWLKLGIFGLLAYLILFAKIIFDGLKINSRYSLSLAAGLIVILTVNIFSPYVNHPLGIGYFILTTVIMNYLKNNFQNTVH